LAMPKVPEQLPDHPRRSPSAKRLRTVETARVRPCISLPRCFRRNNRGSPDLHRAPAGPLDVARDVAPVALALCSHWRSPDLIDDPDPDQYRMPRPLRIDFTCFASARWSTSQARALTKGAVSARARAPLAAQPVEPAWRWRVECPLKRRRTTWIGTASKETGSR
jgi:hypothetical protein